MSVGRFDDPDSAEALERARRQARGSALGVIESKDHAYPVRLVIARREGAILLSCEDDDLEHAGEFVLCLPADAFESMRILLETRIFENERPDLTDRHTAYHGVVHAPVWMIAIPISAKNEEGTWEGDEVIGPDPISGAEFALLKTLNADKHRLADLAERLAHTRPIGPTAVGADALGVDVRTSIGVMRVEWPSELTGPDAAAEQVRRWLHETGGAR